MGMIPTSAMEQVRGAASDELKRLEGKVFGEPKKALQRLLGHGVDDAGSTRVEVIKSLSVLRRGALPSALLKELHAARVK